MKASLKITLFITVMFLTAFTTTAHKYYLSVTKIEYVKEKESVQIVSRIFIDDFETLLRKRYDETITLNVKDEPKIIDLYIERYLKEKIEILINNQETTLVYIGKEYEDDIIYVYLEVENIKAINTFEITNKLLFDIFDEQKNIVRTQINSKNKSFILIKENAKGMLNFN